MGYIAIVLPPRSGGTYRCMEKAIEIGGNVVYLNKKHEAIKHTVATIEKILDKIEISTDNCEYQLIHLTPQKDGKSMVDLYIDDEYEKYPRLVPVRLIEKLYYKGTTDTVPLNKPPVNRKLEISQWKLLHIFQYAVKETPTIALMTPEMFLRGSKFGYEYYDTLIIDENSAIDFFKPKSVRIFTDKENSKFELDYVNESILDSIRDKIPSELHETFNKISSILIQVLKYIDENKTTLPEHGKSKIRNTKKQAMLEFSKKLDSMFVPQINEIPLTERIKLVEHLKRYLIVAPKKEEENLKRLIALSTLLGFHYLRDGKQNDNIYIIADEDILLYKDVFKQFRHIIIRVNKVGDAEWFFSQLGIETSSIDIEIEPDFKYRDNFIVVKTDATEFIKEIYGTIPILALESSTEKAQGLGEKLERVKTNNGIIKTKLFKSQHIDVIRDCCSKNEVIITYSNSSISRGRDLPDIDVVVVFGIYFCLPYEQYISEKSGDNEVYWNAIMDEVEQCLLRIAPIKNVGEDKLKFIVVDKTKRVKLPKNKSHVFRYIDGPTRVNHSRLSKFIIYVKQFPQLERLFLKNKELVFYIFHSPTDLEQFMVNLVGLLEDIVCKSFNSRKELEEYLRQNLTTDRVCISKVINALVKLGILVKYGKHRVRYIGVESTILKSVDGIVPKVVVQTKCTKMVNQVGDLVVNKNGPTKR